MLKIILLLLALPSNAGVNWGLNDYVIVNGCEAQKRCVGPLERFRGRSNKTNGAAATVIWKVGTKRIVAWGAATRQANDLIKEKMDFAHTLFADFTACPMEKAPPSHRTKVCVESIEKPRWVKGDY